MPITEIARGNSVGTLGDRLRQLRAARGWSQRELARRAGLSQPVVSGIESGIAKAPQALTLTKLAQALGVRIDELLGLPLVDPGKVARERLARAQWRYLDTQAPDLPDRAREQMRRLVRDDALSMSDADLAFWTDRMRELGYPPESETEDCPDCLPEAQAG